MHRRLYNKSKDKDPLDPHSSPDQTAKHQHHGCAMQLGNGQRASLQGCDHGAVQRRQQSTLGTGAPCVCVCVCLHLGHVHVIQIEARRILREPRKRKSFEALLAAALPESQRGDISVFGGADRSVA